MIYIRGGGISRGCRFQPGVVQLGSKKESSTRWVKGAREASKQLLSTEFFFLHIARCESQKARGGNAINLASDGGDTFAGWETRYNSNEVTRQSGQS